MATLSERFEGSRVPELLVGGLVALGVVLVGVTGEFVGLEFTLVVYALLWVATLGLLADPEAFAAGPRRWWFGRTSEGPVDVLRRRYARGEIDDAEFERRLERLTRSEASNADPDA